jgi:hypothetical protein
MRQIRKRLTYANVMSSIAVFLVLGGAAFAASGLPKNSVGTKQLKNNAVTSAKVKNNSLTGADIKLSSLGTVPSATNADNATNASQLGGTPAASYVKGPVESVHLIGAAGQPEFQNACANLGLGFQPAGFYKDPFGIIHLVGDITSCSSESVLVFTLPDGFRPTTSQRFSVHNTDTTVGTVRVDPNGEVTTFSDSEPVINGITFRTD